jgi:hypothetical protein
MRSTLNRVALATLVLSISCGLNEDGLAPIDASASGVGGQSGSFSGDGGTGGAAGDGAASGAAARAGAAGIDGGAGNAGSAGSAGSGAMAGAAGAGGSPPLQTCQEIYGTLLTLIEICASNAGECKLAVDTDPNDGDPGQSCLGVCAAKGATCIKVFDNTGNFCTEDPGDERQCDDEGLTEGVCFCTHGT